MMWPDVVLVLGIRAFGLGAVLLAGRQRHDDE